MKVAIKLICSLTCENRLVRVKLSSADSERYVAKFLVLKQQPEIVGQPTLRYFKLCRITLPRDVYTVRHYADLKEIIKLCRYNVQRNEISNKCDNRHTKVYTSQNIVSLSSGSSPLASSKRKSLLMNFLKPQSLPWTNLYARWLSARTD